MPLRRFAVSEGKHAMPKFFVNASAVANWSILVEAANETEAAAQVHKMFEDQNIPEPDEIDSVAEIDMVIPWTSVAAVKEEG